MPRKPSFKMDQKQISDNNFLACDTDNLYCKINRESFEKIKPLSYF